jgi:hypothetical protein
VATFSIVVSRLFGVVKESQRFIFARSDMRGPPRDHESSKANRLFAALANALGDRLRGQMSTPAERDLGLGKQDRRRLTDAIGRAQGPMLESWHLGTFEQGIHRIQNQTIDILGCTDLLG